MNKFYKVILIVSMSCLLLGIVTCTIVGITGGWQLLTNGFDYSYTWDFNHSNNDDKETIEKTFDGDITSLEVSIPFGNIKIKEGTAFSMEAINVAKNSFNKMQIEDGVLIIKQDYDGHAKNFFGINHNYDGIVPKITITVPPSYNAKKITIEVAAGDLEILNITSDYTKLELGAGNVDITKLASENIEINGGAGNLIMNDVNLNNMKLEAGVGNTNVQGILTGEIKIDSGVGNVEVEVVGNEDDYSYISDSGLGSVKFNGQNYNNKQNPNAKNSFEVNSGVGNVTININK